MPLSIEVAILLAGFWMKAIAMTHNAIMTDATTVL